jgi:hypothetical protein
VQAAEEHKVIGDDLLSRGQYHKAAKAFTTALAALPEQPSKGLWKFGGFAATYLFLPLFSPFFCSL